MSLSAEELKNLETESVEALGERVAFGSVLIGALIGDPDPRAPRAMERLRTQQQQINALIAQKTMGERPAPTVVSMQPAAVAGRVVPLPKHAG